ncbi:MAG: hypothetical protein L7F78_16415, partial [Syntrophales bacterium LBB04]|nr:hypothetical protein [Syntrophales bacterium LBB04]
GIVPEEQPPLDAADDDMVEDAGGVETGMAGHGSSYQAATRLSMVIYLFTVVPSASQLPL